MILRAWNIDTSMGYDTYIDEKDLKREVDSHSFTFKCLILVKGDSIKDINTKINTIKKR